MSVQLTKSIMNDIDSSDMYKVYDNWPDIARSVYTSNLEKLSLESINEIVLCGMGGSGSIGDVLSSILSKSAIHVSVVKGYHLPKTINSKSLIVVISVSGNTNETLSVLDNAYKNGSNLIAFSSGGKIEQFCHKKNIEYRKIPFYNSPRASFPAFLYGILNVLESIIPLNHDDIIESISALESTKQNIGSSNLSIESNSALNLGQWLSNITMIYYPSGMSASAIRFKNSLQENSKTHAMAEDVVEACHNGIVAWEQNSIVKPVLIQGVDDFYKTKELWVIFEKYFLENNIDYRKLISINGNILSKLVNLIYVLDYATIYKSILNNIDPTPINSINLIKNKLTDS